MTERNICRRCDHPEVQHSASGAACYWDWAAYLRAPDGPWPCACPGFEAGRAEPARAIWEPPERLELAEPDRPTGNGAAR